MCHSLTVNCIQRQDEGEDDDDDLPLDTPRLKLKKVDANHVKRFRLKINTDGSNDYIPRKKIVKQYKVYPYLNCDDLLVSGYIRDFEVNTKQKILIPPEMMRLCKEYYFVKEDGLYQLTHRIWRVLKQLNRTRVTMKILKVLTMKYLKVNGDEAESYLNETVNLEYIVPVITVNHDQSYSPDSPRNLFKMAANTLPLHINKSNKLYQISSTMSLIFA